MIKLLTDFYFKYCPSFSERFSKDGVDYLFSNFVDDEFSNIALLDDNSKITETKHEFNIRNKLPVFYSFKKPNNNF